MKHTSDAILRADQAVYLESLEPARDALLSEMEAYAREHHCPISDPEVASFLAITTRIAQPACIVELGTNIGYGAIVLARAAGPSAKVISIELDAALCETARGFVRRASLEPRVEVVQGDATKELAKVSTPIDLLYVDCIKSDYPEYLDVALPKLSPRGVVIADNVLWRGLTASDAVPDDERSRVEALRRFNHTITHHPSLRGVILPLGDGVAYATRV